MAKFDAIVTNGLIADGTGRPLFRSDIAFKKGRIEKVEPHMNKEEADQVFNADGLVVSPGFIDTHSHDDLYIPFKPTADQKVLQGVTTVVTGNCGTSPAPISEKERPTTEAFLGTYGAAHLPAGFLNFNTLRQFNEIIEQKKPGINVAPLVGHGTLRMAVKGTSNDPLTTAELEEMIDLTEQAMQNGAFGLSTGLVYPPGAYADTDELVELCRVVQHFGGIYTSHIRSESNGVVNSVREVIEIARRSGVRAHVSHHKCIGNANWGNSQKTLDLMDQARQEGLFISCDQYPYRAASTYLGAVLPPRFLASGLEELKRILLDPAIRKEIKEEIEAGPGDNWENFIDGVGFQNMVITNSKNHPEYVSRSVAEIADAMQKDPYELVFDLLAEETVSIMMIIIVACDEDIERILSAPHTMIGSDGIPGFKGEIIHPRMTGTFPRILGEYVRKKKILSLTEAIRKMTDLPARTFGLTHKGVLKPGFDADIVVFNAETIIDCSTFDTPYTPPCGIKSVFVNGVQATECTTIKGTTSGRVLKPAAVHT